MTKARFCVHCGAELAAEASFCTNCGAQTDLCEQLQSDFSLTAKGSIWKSVIRLTLTMAIIMTLWSLLNIFVPEAGFWRWLQVPINIGFFLYSSAFAITESMALKKLLPGWIAWAISFGILVLGFLLRSVELEIIESVFKS